MRHIPLWFLLFVVGLAACTPTFDWRDVRPEGAGLEAQLPCRPQSVQRRIELAGAPVDMTLVSCSAGSSTWALGWADMGDPARVAPALAALAAAAQANLGAAAASSAPFDVPGMTPQPGSVRLSLEGRAGQEAPLQEQVAVFSKGTRVYQAAVIGHRVPADAALTFFEALRLP